MGCEHMDVWSGIAHIRVSHVCRVARLTSALGSSAGRFRSGSLNRFGRHVDHNDDKLSKL